jgi:hypothetical protein
LATTHFRVRLRTMSAHWSTTTVSRRRRKERPRDNGGSENSRGATCRRYRCRSRNLWGPSIAGPAKNLSATARVNSLPRALVGIEFHPPETDVFELNTSRESELKGHHELPSRFVRQMSHVGGTTKVRRSRPKRLRGEIFCISLRASARSSVLRWRWAD